MLMKCLQIANSHINATLVLVVVLNVALLGLQFRAAFKMFAIRKRKVTNLASLSIYTFTVMLIILLCRVIAELAMLVLGEIGNWGWEAITVFLSWAMLVYFGVLIIIGAFYLVQTFVYNFRR